jgi:hypothetical protein
MKRFFYRCLIWLHPPAFRQRFGDEMLYIFDERAGAPTAQLFVDIFISLPRQWVVRSGLWKLVLATAMSSILFAVEASGLIYWPRRSIDPGTTALRSPGTLITPLERIAFSRSAAQAVAMLARFQKDDETRRRLARHSTSHPAAAPSPDKHADPS